MKNILTFILAFFIIKAVYAQKGKVEIVGNPSIDELIEERKQNLDSNKQKGYRIQVFFGSNMSEASQSKYKIIRLFPEWSDEVYMKYVQPSYRVRIGNFSTKFEAQVLLLELQKDFKSVFIVKDEIELPTIRF